MQHNIVLSFLTSRGITEDVIALYNIHKTIHQLLGDAIAIPVHDENGTMIFSKYRRMPTSTSTSTLAPKYLYDAGSKVTLYGYDKVKNEHTILITEGELDALVAVSNGIPAVSSTGGAQSFQKEWVDLLREKKVYVCFDNDQAGGLGMARVWKMFIDEQLPSPYMIFLPDRPGVKDISDYVQAGGDIQILMSSGKQFNHIADVYADRVERIALWRSTHFHDAVIEKHEHDIHVLKSEARTNYVGEDDVAKAKAVPIPKLMKFSGKKACCVFHNEKTPSMVYFQNDNHVYCFGCNKIADSIDVYRALEARNGRTISFKEAVNELVSL
jgi:DNA primase